MKRYILPLLLFSLLGFACQRDLPTVPVKPAVPEEEYPEAPAIDNQRVSDLLAKMDLNDFRMAKVKEAFDAQDFELTKKELLQYFRYRTHVRHLKVNKEDKDAAKGQSIKAEVKQQADLALQHKFTINSTYGAVDCGVDINWMTNPSGENESQWQIHRMNWWSPMGETYWKTGDERYAKEWIFELRDWIKKNPNDRSHQAYRWAWRALEVSQRVDDQTALFNYFVLSENFTPDFLIEFLENYYVQANHIINNFPDEGNHLLFCGQRVLTGGCFFQEFKDAATWRSEGARVLNKEINVQVLPDGVQFEYTPRYHLAAIQTFLEAMDVANLNMLSNAFPSSYKDRIHKMMEVVMDLCVFNSSSTSGNYIFGQPMFGDSQNTSSSLRNNNFKIWNEKYFPSDDQLKYFATDGAQGTAPAHASAMYPDGGFYALRSGWDKKGQLTNKTMVIAANPTDVWHAHPDNGTFELSVNGRLFMPDAGYYKYEGNSSVNKMRNWFRRSRVHKIMTLDNKNIQKKNNVLLKWDVSGTTEVFAFENQSYENLKVRRTIFLADKSSAPFYVIVDEAIGSATGALDVHYQLAEAATPTVDKVNNKVTTGYADNNNLFVAAFSADGSLSLRDEFGDAGEANDLLEGEPETNKNKMWISYKGGEKVEGTGFKFHMDKADGSTKSIVTVIYPVADAATAPVVSLTSVAGTSNSLSVVMSIGGTSKTFSW